MELQKMVVADDFQINRSNTQWTDQTLSRPSCCASDNVFKVTALKVIMNSDWANELLLYGASTAEGQYHHYIEVRPLDEPTCAQSVVADFQIPAVWGYRWGLGR